MARVRLSGGSPGKLSMIRMPQIRHMKPIFRRGVNPASGSVPAGVRVTFLRKPTAQRGRR